MHNTGALKTLMTMLSEAPSLADATIVFGEEMVHAQDQALPMVVVVPTGGTWMMPGYYKNGNVDVNNIWMTSENIDLYLWAASIESDSTPVDHANAVEALRAAVLQAFQDQQPYGLMYRPISGRWMLGHDELNRYGRAYVLTISVDTTVPDVVPVEPDVSKTTINATISV